MFFAPILIIFFFHTTQKILRICMGSFYPPVGFLHGGFLAWNQCCDGLRSFRECPQLSTHDCRKTPAPRTAARLIGVDFPEWSNPILEGNAICGGKFSVVFWRMFEVRIQQGKTIFFYYLGFS